MAGRVCLVTGATSGIGRVTVRELARRGAALVGVGRDATRCASAADAIRRDTENADVEFLCADLSSQTEVRRVASEFLARHDRLHVLVNNVGALFALRRESVDGIEMTLALNHLAPFLLTTLLLDALRAGAPSRVVNVSSDAHEMISEFDFEDPQAKARSKLGAHYGRSEVASFLFSVLLPRSHPGLRQYARSKLANLLFTYELARRLRGTGIVVHAVHPGFIASNFSDGNGSYGWFMRRWASFFGIDAEEGARTTLHAATAPELERVTGLYFSRGERAESSPPSKDGEAADRLWKLSEQWTGLRADARN